MLLQKKHIWRQFSITNEIYHYDKNFPLLSIHVASNRPDQITEFIKNIHSTCENKNAYEIIVKVDAEDPVMIACVNKLEKQYGEQHVKILIGPRKQGPWSLWEFYNQLYCMAHEKAYFMCLFSDEVRFSTPGWDQILKKYIGFYKDNIFRLKLSDNHLRNFYRMREVMSSPDNFPFITRKWMDICGLWGDCHSPDTFQQAVSYYLGKSHIFRDIPVFDIQLSGLDAGLLLPPEKIKPREQTTRKLWSRALSRPMRSRYFAHAMKLKFFIESCKEGTREINFNERTTYPSRVICTNDKGNKAIFKCEIYGFNIYGLKLIASYFKFKIKDAIYAFLIHPLASILFIVSSLLLLLPESSLITRIISLVLVCLSIWNYKLDYIKKTIRNKNEMEINP